MQACHSQLVPWVRRPRFVYEKWDDEEVDDDGADYKSVFNPYDVLGLPCDPRPVHVSLTCPFYKAEIHNAYLELSRRLHPDRRGDGINRRLNWCPWIAPDEQFKAITAAHNLLMDPYLRSRYHLCKDIENQEVYAVMVAAKQARAIHELEHMQFQFEDVVAEQAAMQGLLIVRALYGDVKQIERFLDSDDMDIQDAIDVTVPIQILVQRAVHQKTGREIMKIELPGKSKSLLDGFYDPNIGNDKHLGVRYTYKGRLHQVFTGDTDALRLPLPSHVLTSASKSSHCTDENADPTTATTTTTVKSFRAHVPLTATAAQRRASIPSTPHSHSNIGSFSGNNAVIANVRLNGGHDDAAVLRPSSHINIGGGFSFNTPVSVCGPGKSARSWKVVAPSTAVPATTTAAPCTRKPPAFHVLSSSSPFPLKPVVEPTSASSSTASWQPDDFSVWLQAAEATAVKRLSLHSAKRHSQRSRLLKLLLAFVLAAAYKAKGAH